MNALIDYGRMLDVIGIEVELLAASVHGQHLERQVPACPGLNIGETARHVGSGHRMALSWIRGGKEPSQWQRDPAEEQDLSDFVRSGVVPLLDELSAHDPEEPCATWWPAQSHYGFWRRRFVHESTVHRVDVQAAAGIPVDAVDDEVAMDGVDEILSLWFTHRLDMLGVRGSTDGTVAIRTGHRVWLARSGPTGSSAWLASPEEADLADAEVTSTPANVYLWLWGRIPDREMEVVGDHDAIAQLWALLRLATR